MIRRFAVPIAIAVTVVVFVVFFLLLGGAGLPVQLGVPAAAAAIAAVGAYLMLAGTARQAEADTYQAEAQAKVASVRRILRQITTSGSRIRDAELRADLDRACQVVPELLDRIAETDPNSLYSSASRLEGHVQSLQGLVEQYADIERNPDYYTDAPRLLTDGRAAVERFDEFAIESIRLVNSGDMAEYRANLDTVAPPKIPKLEG
ncbi:5-bromo-4-chloroindolyl phosphate hydrolysis family protein [Granulicoccus phenolivorans]|uniref:5-bromo-4-chloroindolyl phosphate hydrolysis family protein n=1 Tax=Granulicoccus phenolivorans TaxID=266854 RepID=UPI000416FEE8|nr:5-bromo-4-chloroindolyl phosphate hydrolysis family protein [Granulicoccus phenolivorans]